MQASLNILACNIIYIYIAFAGSWDQVCLINKILRLRLMMNHLTCGSSTWAILSPEPTTTKLSDKR